MAYLDSNGHVTDDVTLPRKVMTPIYLGPLSRQRLKIRTWCQWITYGKWHIHNANRTTVSAFPYKWTSFDIMVEYTCHFIWLFTHTLSVEEYRLKEWNEWKFNSLLWLNQLRRTCTLSPLLRRRTSWFTDFTEIAYYLSYCVILRPLIIFI